LTVSKSILSKISRMFNNIAYVSNTGNNATGMIGNPAKHFATAAAAIAAAESSSQELVLKVLLGSFDAPPQSALSRGNITIIGSGRPFYNSNVTQASMSAIGFPAPTKLVGGTIFKGALKFLDVASGIKIYNLGVDVGPDYLAAGGTEDNGVLIYRSTANDGSTTDTTPYPLTTNIELKNLIVLGKNSSSAFHGVDIENSFNPSVEDIITCYATHGVAIKCNHGNFKNITAFNHATDGIIIKSNSYSNCTKINLNGFATYNCGAGVILQNRNAVSAMSDINIVNGFCQGGVNGFKVINDYNQGFKSISLDNIHVRGASSTGFLTTGLTSSNTRMVGCWDNDTLTQI